MIYLAHGLRGSIHSYLTLYTWAENQGIMDVLDGGCLLRGRKKAEKKVESNYNFQRHIPVTCFSTATHPPNISIAFQYHTTIEQLSLWRHFTLQLSQTQRFDWDPAFLVDCLFIVLPYLWTSKLLQPFSFSLPPSLLILFKRFVYMDVCALCVQYLQRCTACNGQKRVSEPRTGATGGCVYECWELNLDILHEQYSS